MQQGILWKGKVVKSRCAAVVVHGDLNHCFERELRLGRRSSGEPVRLNLDSCLVSLLQPDSLHTSERYIRPDGAYIGMVHPSGRYLILVYYTATVIARITVCYLNESRPEGRESTG